MSAELALRSIKYIASLLLVVAVVEATTYPVIYNALGRIGVACLFLLYGVGTLMLFLRPSGEVEGASAPAWKAIRGTAYHILFRVAFIFCALAYFAQAVGLYDQSIVLVGGGSGYWSFFVSIFRYTVPPVADIFETLFPSVSLVSWNTANTLTLMLKWLTYLIYVFVIVGTLREVTKLAREGKFGEMIRRTRKVATREGPYDGE